MKKIAFLYILISFVEIIFFVNISSFSLAEEEKEIKDRIKIGVIDVHKFFEEFHATAKAREKLKEEYEKERKKIEEVEKEIEELQRAIKAEAVEKKQKEELEKKLKDTLENYQRMVTVAQENLERREKELTQEIMSQIYDAINKVAKEKDLDLVLDKGSILYWGGEVIDIEEGVREKLK